MVLELGLGSLVKIGFVWSLCLLAYLVAFLSFCFGEACISMGLLGCMYVPWMGWWKTYT